ncbi:thioredoxin reductase [Terriglobus roseus DSM 18391]|uniref:Thioredoxin reductase n=1 Tax=Terriglobus roseus (strain DSM 18391 / NRRL B-41598 / KBS 63) TaxID=926566 RepID=I3ZK35_TERRK|nr:FAD-dependent oxidoreductase [Terriglobus roseus]AFL89603.1 thioredoxin reductase [Terriglobus roseus DSM 18391]
MARPILLAVDDDTSVLEAVVGDLRRKYAQEYRIVRAASGQAALDTCTQLKDRGDAVALFLSDQRMPGMTGVDFLSRAITLYPDAKRVLLTAYADTEAAIRAINTAKIHYYLNKPWDPPEEKLYPVLDDLLVSWHQGYKPPYEGLQVVGTRWGSQDHAVRDFLSRNHVSYRWLNPEAGNEAADALKARGLDDSKLPVVIFSDGTAAVQPTQMELAEKVGLKTQADNEFYDVVVVGAGPAGLAAGVYGASEGLRTLVVEPDAVGGQAGSSSRIENYLGFPQGISGDELAKRGFIQAQRLGAEFVTQRVMSIELDKQYRIVKLEDGREVSCSVVLVATGVSWCKLDVPGSDALVGAGVYYGAAQSEAAACKDEEVFVVGGANSAGQAAMNFAKYARKVTMLVRGKGLESSMSKYLIDQIAAMPNIVVETGTEITRFCGMEHLEGIELKTPRGTEYRSATSVFIFIGAAPKTHWLPEQVCRDERGFVLAGPDLKRVGIERMAGNGGAADRDPYLLETSVPGIFVAGDVRHGSVKRAASAVGEGSIAIQFVHQYLAGF